MVARITSSVINNIPYFILFLLQLPALWYSINTPFSLIDDYSSWKILKVLSGPGDFAAWLKDIFFHFNPGRFRPVFDLYNYLTWSLFGTNYTLHHLARFAMKYAIAFFSIKTITLFKPIDNRLNLPVFVFLSLFLFYPNNPEARLAPVELELVLFLSIGIHYAAVLWMRYDGAINDLPLKDYMMLLASYVLMSFSKETALAPASAILFFILLSDSGRRGIMKILPFALTFLFCIVKVFFVSRNADYGTAKITPSLIKSNFLFYSNSLFLTNISGVFIVLLVILGCFVFLSIRALIRLCLTPQAEDTVYEQRIRTGTWTVLRSVGQDKRSVFYVFLVLVFLLFYIMTITFWAQVLRYNYPLAYMLVLLLSLGFTLPEVSSFFSKNVARAGAVAICFYFIFSTHYFFMYQHASQYSSCRNEERALNAVRELLKEGKKVYVYGKDEYHDNIYSYFTDYLPFFEKISYAIKRAGSFDLFEEDSFYLAGPCFSPGFSSLGHRSIRLFSNDEYLYMLDTAGFVSSTLLHENQLDVLIDGGALLIGGEKWEITYTRGRLAE